MEFEREKRPFAEIGEKKLSSSWRGSMLKI